MPGASRAISRCGGMSERITGHSQAIASRTATGRPSPRDADTKKSARQRYRYTSSRTTVPVMCTLLASPTLSSASTISAPQGPSPTEHQAVTQTGGVEERVEHRERVLDRDEPTDGDDLAGRAGRPTAPRRRPRGTGPPWSGPRRSARPRCRLPKRVRSRPRHRLQGGAPASDDRREKGEDQVEQEPVPEPEALPRVVHREDQVAAGPEGQEVRHQGEQTARRSMHVHGVVGASSAPVRNARKQPQVVPSPSTMRSGRRGDRPRQGTASTR